MANINLTAKSKYLGRSARKVRLIADAVRGMNAEVAMAHLQYLNKGGAVEMRKVIASAVANAKHNYKLDSADLVVATVMVDEAPMFKRFRAGSKGSGRRILRHNCHITVTLANQSNAKAEDKTVAPKAEAKKDKAESKKADTTVKKVTKKANTTSQNTEDGK